MSLCKSLLYSLYFFWPSHARCFFRGEEEEEEEEEENFHSIVTSLTINKMVAAIFDARSGSTERHSMAIALFDASLLYCATYQQNTIDLNVVYHNQSPNWETYPKSASVLLSYHLIFLVILIVKEFNWKTN